MTLEEQINDYARQGLLGIGLDDQKAQDIAPYVGLLAQFIPGVGLVTGGDNTIDAINDGRYGDAAIEGGLTLLGEIPGVGDLAASAIKGIRRVPDGALRMADGFDEEAWIKANPRPEGKRNENPEVNAWLARRSYKRKNASKEGYDSLGEKIKSEPTDAEWLAENPRPPGKSTDTEVQAWQQRRNRARRTEGQVAAERAADAEAQRLRRANNGEHINSLRRKRYNANKDQINASRREASAKKRPEKTLSPEEEQFLKQNPHPFPDMDERALTASEKRALNAWYTKKNRALNPVKTRAKYRAEAANRKAALLQRTAPWSNQAKIDEIYQIASEVTRRTGAPYEVDHVIPLRGKSVSGLHHQDNLLIVPAIDNRIKNRKFEPGDLPPRAGIRKARALLKKIKKAQGIE